MKAQAYCPCAISFIFKSCPDPDVYKHGSIGLGCTIDKGVTATVIPSSATKIFLNNKPINIPPVFDAIKILTNKNVELHVECLLPLGCGFGLSGATTLSALYVINRLLQLEKTCEELARIAHQSEIINGTGLGTVATEITGGFLLKTKSGLPTKAVHLPFVGEKLYAIILGSLDTQNLLKKNLEKNNNAADAALEKIKNLKHPSLQECLKISYIYAQKNGFLSPSIKLIIDQLHNQDISGTMAIFGEVIFCDKKPRLDENFRIEELQITNSHVQLVY